MYQHIFWDFDGTLFNTYPAMARALQKALAEHGHTVDEKRLLTHMKVTLSHAIEHFAALFALDAQALAGRVDAWRAVEEPRLCIPYDGIPALCRAIRRDGRSNYLYTHRDHTALDMLRRFDMEANFADIVTSEAGFARKPSPQALLYLLQKHGINPRDAVMIGDRDLDVQCGQNAGMDGCFFALDGGEPGGRTAHTVYTLAQLERVIGLQP